jgi:hypothetical protein
MGSENKLRPTPDSVADFIAAVEHPLRRADAQALCRMMEEVSGESPVLWSHSIIGFGRYHYRYDTGREGVAGASGFRGVVLRASSSRVVLVRARGCRISYWGIAWCLPSPWGSDPLSQGRELALDKAPRFLKGSLYV